MATNIILSKESSESEIQAYFHAVLELSKTSDNEFPINLDDIWTLVYTQKGHALRDLKKNFIESIDYNLSQNGKVVTVSELQNGVAYQCHLTLSCMEFFIARKVRPVFEVYRQVFHRVATMHTPAIYPEPDRKKRLEELISLIGIGYKVGIDGYSVRPIIEEISRCISNVKELSDTINMLGCYTSKLPDCAMQLIVLAYMGRCGINIDMEDPYAKEFDRNEKYYRSFEKRLRHCEFLCRSDYFEKNWEED